ELDQPFGQCIRVGSGAERSGRSGRGKGGEWRRRKGFGLMQQGEGWVRIIHHVGEDRQIVAVQRRVFPRLDLCAAMPAEQRIGLVKQAVGGCQIVVRERGGGAAPVAHMASRRTASNSWMGNCSDL